MNSNRIIKQNIQSDPDIVIRAIEILKENDYIAIEYFIKRVIKARSYCNQPELLLDLIIADRIRGYAKESIRCKEIDTYETLFKELLKIATKKSVTDCRRNLMELVQYNNETIQEYNKRFYDAFYKLKYAVQAEYTKIDERTIMLQDAEKMALDIYIDNLIDEIHLLVAARNPKTINEAQKLAAKREYYIKNIQQVIRIDLKPHLNENYYQNAHVEKFNPKLRKLEKPSPSLYSNKIQLEKQKRIIHNKPYCRNSQETKNQLQQLEKLKINKLNNQNKCLIHSREQKIDINDKTKSLPQLEKQKMDQSNSILLPAKEKYTNYNFNLMNKNIGPKYSQSITKEYKPTENVNHVNIVSEQAESINSTNNKSNKNLKDRDFNQDKSLTHNYSHIKNIHNLKKSSKEITETNHLNSNKNQGNQNKLTTYDEVITKSKELDQNDKTKKPLNNQSKIIEHNNEIITKGKGLDQNDNLIEPLNKQNKLIAHNKVKTKRKEFDNKIKLIVSLNNRHDQQSFQIKIQKNLPTEKNNQTKAHKYLAVKNNQFQKIIVVSLPKRKVTYNKEKFIKKNLVNKVRNKTHLKKKFRNLINKTLPSAFDINPSILITNDFILRNCKKILQNNYKIAKDLKTTCKYNTNIKSYVDNSRKPNQHNYSKLVYDKSFDIRWLLQNRMEQQLKCKIIFNLIEKLIFIIQFYCYYSLIILCSISKYFKNSDKAIEYCKTQIKVKFSK